MVVVNMNGVHLHPLLHQLMMAPPLHQQVAAALHLVVINVLPCVLLLEKQKELVIVIKINNAGPHLMLHVVGNHLKICVLEAEYSGAH